MPTQYLNLPLGVFDLIRRVIDSGPEKVEDQVIKDIDNLRVLLHFKCLPNLINELGRIDNDHAEEGYNELEEPDSLPDPDLDLVDLELIVCPVLATVLNSEELDLLLLLLIFIVQLKLLFLPILV